VLRSRVICAQVGAEWRKAEAALGYFSTQADAGERTQKAAESTWVYVRCVGKLTTLAGAIGQLVCQAQLRHDVDPLANLSSVDHVRQFGRRLRLRLLNH
jgi:hypothetical protein